MVLRQRNLDIVAGLFAALGHSNDANGPKYIIHACVCQLCVGELRFLGHGKGHEPVFSSILAGNASEHSLQSDAWCLLNPILRQHDVLESRLKCERQRLRVLVWHD